MTLRNLSLDKRSDASVLYILTIALMVKSTVCFTEINIPGSNPASRIYFCIIFKLHRKLSLSFYAKPNLQFSINLIKMSLPVL